MRRPLYGGERGIRNRDTALKQKFYETGYADFSHDFGEGVPERDKFTGTDLLRFQEIAQGYGISKFKALTTGFDSVLNKNPYTLMKTTLPGQIFPELPPGTDSKEITDEIKALDNLGLNFSKIKSDLKAKLGAGETGKETPIVLPNITLPIPGENAGTRTYRVRAVLMKDKANERVLNIASRFEQVTGNKSKIALIVDASGGLSMTALLNDGLTPLPSKKMEFYIIENIENSSDSATKLKSFDKPTGDGSLSPNLYFLKDETNTVLYPKFSSSAIQGEKDGELLFGNADLVLSRAGDEMEADFTFGEDETYHIDNVSQNANVKNASLNIIASTIAGGGTVTDEEVIPAPGDRKPYLFPYIKRVGDWCQALSLLDGTRKYNKLNAQHLDTKEQTTLDDLRNDSECAVGLLTLDRILLGYALTLGINVFFTTATDLRLLIYFENTEEALTPEQLDVEIGKLQTEYDNALGTIGKDNVAAILDEAVAFVAASKGNTEYIQNLRGALYRVSVLRTEFDVITKKINEITVKVANPATPPLERYAAYFEGATLLRKLKSDETHNQTQLASLKTYPALVDEKGAFDMINNRPSSRDADSKLRVILSKNISNDAKQTRQVFEKYGKQDRLKEMVAFQPVEPNAAVFASIFRALGEVRIVFGAPLVGGGPEDIEVLTQFIVTPLTKQEYDTYANPVKPIPDMPLPLVRGSFYRDKNSLPYTVVDEFIITKDDLPVFQRILTKGLSKTTTDPQQQAFITKRLILLYLDMLQGELEKVEASEDDDITIIETVQSDKETINQTKTIPSDVKTSNHMRIFYIATKLLDTINSFVSKNEFDSELIQSTSDYVGANLLDNEEIKRIAKGTGGLRNSKDFKKTFEKLKTARIALFPPSKKRGRSEEPQVMPTSSDVSMLEEPSEEPATKKANTAVGGLRRRRSKHRNAQSTDSTFRIHDNSSRLRKRTRTRRTSRVRQSTRKSKPK